MRIQQRGVSPGGLVLLFCALMMLGTAFNVSSQALKPRTYLLHVLRGVQEPNFLRPSSAALDSWRGLLYLASEDAKAVGVVDAASGEQRPSLPLPLAVPRPFTIRHVHPRSRLILGSSPDPAGEHTRITALDPLSGKIAGSLQLEAAPRLHFVSHPDENLLFLSTGGEHILILDGSTLQVVDSIDAGMPTGGMALDSIHQQLFVTQSHPMNGVMRVKTFSTYSLQQTRSFVYYFDVPMDRIVADPKLQRFALVGEGTIRIYDEFGSRLREFPVSTPIGDVGYSNSSNRLLFLDPTGRSHLGGHGRFGTLYRISLNETDADSMAVGLDARTVMVYQTTNEAVVVNHGSSNVDVLYVPDRSRRRTVSLGHSIEDIAIPDRGNNVLVTNAEGSGTTLSVVDIEHPSLHAVEAGVWPVRFAPGPGTERITMAHHFEGVLQSLDAEEGFILTRLTISDVPEILGNAFPSIHCTAGGIAVAVYPEWEHYALVNIDLGIVQRIGNIDGYRYKPGSGPGTLQTVFTRRGDRFAILRTDALAINIYGTTSGVLQKEIVLSEAARTRLQPFLSRCLTQGENADALRLGPYRIDAATGAIDSLDTRGSVEVLGSDTAGRIWAIRHDTSALMLLSSSSGNFSENGERLLLDAASNPDAVRMNATRGIVALGYSAAGRLLIYTLPSSTVAQGIPVASSEDQISIFPHPLHSGAEANFTVVRAIGTATRSNESNVLTVVDALGRKAWTVELGPELRSSQSYSLRIPDLRAGTYRCFLASRSALITSRPFFVLR